MTDAMNEFKTTADAHMRRDIESGGKWVCQCEACNAIRSLIGVDKMLGIRPLVREIEDTETQLDGMAEGPEKRRLQEHYLNLYDRLANEMAKERKPT